jgi:alginate O-acetyltransferase complex protein AlgI
VSGALRSARLSAENARIRALLFNSFIFLFAFLPVAYVVFWLLKTTRARYVWLTITGYVFYGYWNPWFCFLMAFSTLTSYSAGLGLARWTSPRARKLCLVIPITVDLSLLGFFKYANFAAASVGSLFGLFGVRAHVPHWNIILPIGISFYTFHTITYIVDSYRGVIRPTRNLFEFSAYVSLFSQLVAGPIVRFRQIEADLESLGKASRTRWLARGISFFMVGMVEKVVIADTIAFVIDPALAHYTTLSSVGAWLAMLGYTYQLYFDFCGYSDMAIGLGYMFGLRIPVNFNSPYKALDPSDFWRRWHISLSRCLRDYLYIPFGGNRGGEVKTYRNLMLTMLIGGLWHGANWTFVFWGGYHGMLLALYRRFASRWDGLPKALRQAAMFFAALIGWVFFRSTTFGMAAVLLRTMFTPISGVALEHASLLVPLIAGAAWWSMIGPNAQDLHESWELTPRKAVALAAAFGACLAIMAGAGKSPFLYYQF